MGNKQGKSESDSVLISTGDFFNEAVEHAFVERRFQTFPSARSYLVKLLEYYVPAGNLFDEVDEQGRRTRSTLAETFLRAMNSEPHLRADMLKKMADRALYITGFFND